MTELPLMQLVIAGSSIGGSLGLVLVAVKWTANFIAGRIDRSQDRLDEGTQLLIAHLRDQIAILVNDCRELRDWRTEAEKELRECERRHAESEARVRQLEATFQGYGDAKQLAALQRAADRTLERKGKE